MHIFKMRNADHILLLRVRVSLLPGEAAAHGSVPLCISGKLGEGAACLIIHEGEGHLSAT